MSSPWKPDGPEAGESSTPGSRSPPEPPSPAVVFDPDLALELCVNNQEMLSKMVRRFLEDADIVLPELRVALQSSDLAAVGRLGHRLKGTLLYLGAERATQAALRVERFERHGGQQAEAEAAVATLEREYQLLKSALARADTKLGTASQQ